MINRNIDVYMARWKATGDRKVLLLRGARQVGKTYSVRHLATQFQSFIEVNFIERPEVANFFKSGSLAPEQIIEKLQAYYGVSLIPGESLLFFDEIQECQEAITSLRFFHENMKNLHVVAAGSLLEFALAEIPSFGVGRIESLYMYPLCFEEFLGALNQENLVTAIHKSSPQNPLDQTLHKRACELLKTYTLVGGLPEVVAKYVSSKDINQCLSLLDGILVTYQDDFAKYKTRISPLKLRETLLSVARQAGKKFVYSHVNPGASPTGYDQSLELLRLAGLVYKIQNTPGNGIPLGSEVDPAKFKVIPLDIGLYHRLLGLNISEVLLDDEVAFVNRGALAEMICGTEIIAHLSPLQSAHLYYWSREVRGSNAEIDYLVQKGGELVPIEVKAGTKGQMQSLYKFLTEKNYKRGIRSSLENFGSFIAPDGNAHIEVVPIYALGEYISTL
jgi:predicted AAA+ superfamily ATPase